MSSARPHVVSLIEGLGGGGAERIAVDIAIGHAERGSRSQLWLTRPLSERADARGEWARARAGGVELHALLRESSRDVSAWTPLRRALGDGVDVLHAHMFGSNVWAALWGPGRVPVTVAHEHTWSWQGQRVRHLLNRHWIARRADRVICVSQHDRDQFLAHTGIDPDRVAYIPNGIPLGRGTTAPGLREMLGIPATAPVIGTIAAVRPQKRLERLVAAATEITRTGHHDVHLVIAGDGPAMGELRAAVARSGLGARAHLLGRTEDIAPVLGALDVLCVTSDFEGWPLAVTEAMAAGVAVCATNVGALPQMIRDRHEGLLVPPDDPAALVGALGRLLGDPTERATLAAAAAERAAREFSHAAMMDAIDALYAHARSG